TISNALLSILMDKRKFMGPPERDWRPFRHFYINGAAYGGLFGTSRGLVAYAQGLLKTDCPWLSDSFRKERFRERSAGGRATGMSYSWFTGMLGNNRYFAHAGGGGGFYVGLRLFSELRLVIGIMFYYSVLEDVGFMDRVVYFV